MTATLDYSLTRTTDPVGLPVTLDELKDHLAINDSEQDKRLDGLLRGAVAAVERDTGRSLLTQTWTLRLDGGFPEVIELQYPPIQSVSSITYLDNSGTTQTLSTDVYDVDTASEPGFIRRAYDQSWPTTRGDDRGITIMYVAGYGAASDVPYELKEAIKLSAQLQYDCPVVQLVNAYDRLIRAWRTGEYP